MTPVIGAVVDAGELVTTVVASLVAGLGITLVFSLAIAGAVRFVDMRRDGRMPEAAALAALTTLALLASAAGVVSGIVVMTQK